MITHDSPKGYLEVISCTGMESEEIDEEMSDYQRWLVQQKIIVLTLALVQAKKNGMFEELGCMLRSGNQPSKIIRNKSCKVLTYRKKLVPRISERKKHQSKDASREA